MKKIYLISIICCVLFSCTSEDITINTDMGYLRLDVNTVTNTNTKGVVPENYNPKQLYVAIVDAEGKTVASTENFASEWGNGKEFQLKSGVYSIKANSNGFDGLASRYGETPYYAGETTVTVKAGNSVSANLVCTLADVKVTVRFESSFSKAFKAAETEISTAVENVTSLKFAMGSVNSIGYLPVGDLSSSITVQTQAGEFKSQNNEVIKNVQPRDHYIFVYKVDLEGDGKIEVEADDSQRTYTYIFPVTTTPSTTAKVDAANAWSNFAYLSGSVAPKDPTTVIPVDKVKFEYQLASAEEESDSWTSISVEANGTNAYKATLKGLTPNTGYRYRLNYTGDSESSVSSSKSFVTETQPTVPNLSFDNWNDAAGYPSPNASGSPTFWDTGNPGANSAGITPTESVSSDVIKGKAAKLHSEWVDMVVVQTFAAGNIYTGSFKEAIVNFKNPGAKLNFGQPFDGGRPTHLNGYYKYNPGNVNRIGKTDAIKEGDPDQCSIYIALLDWTAPFEVNTTTSTFVDFTSPSVIAYGQLEEKYSVNQKMDSYQEFTIDIKYRDLVRKPKYILIVASASKYGDYFTGSDSSVLLIDEFSLEYKEPVIDTNYIK